MRNTSALQPDIVVTPIAVSVLSQLRAAYGLNLKFRVFDGGFDGAALRVHDRDYDGDIIMERGGAAIALCRNTFFANGAIRIDCRAVPDPRVAFELLLHINDRLTTILSGTQVVERIEAPAPTAVDEIAGDYMLSETR